MKTEKFSTHMSKLLDDIQNMSEKEKVQMKCDTFNDSAGDLNLADGYDCPICNNKGMICECVEEARADGTFNYREVVKKCKCDSIRKSIRRLKRSGLENVIKQYTFDKYVAEEDWQKAILDKAKKFCTDDDAKWFFIGGSNGAGKSHICTAICGHYLRRKGAEVRYMLWRDEIVPIKAVVNDHKQYEELIGELKRVEVLYIDDLFKVIKGNDGKPLPPTPADVQIAYEILNYRYNNHLTTIISCERYLSEIMEIDEAIGSRIMEMVGGYFTNVLKDKSRNYRIKMHKIFDTI